MTKHPAFSLEDPSLITERTVARFNARVSRADGDACWTWTGTRVKRPGGVLSYGKMSILKRPVLAHRLAYAIARGPFPNSAKVCHCCDNVACVLVGVAVFSQPVNSITLDVLPCGRSGGVELGRLVLLDDVPGNGETWFLGRCFEMMRKDGFGGVVSFSDPFERTDAAGNSVFGGHVGTIYQAHNAVYLGRAAANTLKLLPSGNVFSARAISKLRAGERGWRYAVAQLVEAGAKPFVEGECRLSWMRREMPRVTRMVRHPGNHRYIWNLDPRTRRKMPKSLPYPKLDVDRQMRMAKAAA